MAEMTCPECDERIPVKSGMSATKSGRVLCPTCGAQVALLLLSRADPDEAPKPAEPTGKIKPASKPRKRRDDDDDDYDHDHPRRHKQQGGANVGPAIGVIVAIVVIIGVVVGVVSVVNKQREQTNNPAPPLGGANPNVNPLPVPPGGPVWTGPTDTRAAENALKPPEPPFAVDPLLEEAARPVYLADMQEFGVSMGPWKFGKGELGDSPRTPIKVTGKLSPKGLSVHPWDRGATRVAYALGGKAVTLSGTAALNDHNSESFSPVVFVIVGDGRELWRSKPVNRASGPASFRADVRGVKVLELRAILLGAHIGAHAVWVEPLLEQ